MKVQGHRRNIQGDERERLFLGQECDLPPFLMHVQCCYQEVAKNS
jgi:hypothetical protein